MGAYISMSSEVGGRALIGAWVLTGMNTVTYFHFVVPKRLHIKKK